MKREEGSFSVDHSIEALRGPRGRRNASTVLQGAPPPRAVEAGRLHRLTRLMALAIRMRRLVDEGVVRDYSDLARFGGVSIPRMTQIMRLVLLAPDIQEEILSLPRVIEGRDLFYERTVREIGNEPRWAEQRVSWNRLKASARADRAMA